MPLLKTRRRTYVVILTVLMMCLCVSLYLAGHRRLWEWWYLVRLEAAQDPAVRIALIEKIGDVGSDKAFVVLVAKSAEALPEVILVKPSVETEIDVRDRGGPMFPGIYYSAAIIKIRERIGRTKAIALLLKYLKDGSSISARVQCAQHILFAVTPLELLPSPLREQLSDRVAAGQELLMMREAMDDAVAVLILGLRSDNVRVRAGAAFALGLCGARCAEVTPMLSALADDPNDMVRTAARDAIDRIREDVARKEDKSRTE